MAAPEYIGPAFIAGIGSLPLKELIRIIYFFQHFEVDRKFIWVSGIFI